MMFRKHILLFLWIFLFSCGSRSDEAIQQDIQKQLQEQGEANSNVSATVQDGVVTLSGSCIGENCADSIAQKIQDIDGVDEVRNNLEQQQAATDLTLRTSVQTIISKYQGVQADVANGVIVLRGVINRDQVQPLMNELNNLHPEKIDNQLAVE